MNRDVQLSPHQIAMTETIRQMAERPFQHGTGAGASPGVPAGYLPGVSVLYPERRPNPLVPAEPRAPNRHERRAARKRG